jgi:hypothetical protein
MKKKSMTVNDIPANNVYNGKRAVDCPEKSANNQPGFAMITKKNANHK